MEAVQTVRGRNWRHMPYRDLVNLALSRNVTTRIKIGEKWLRKTREELLTDLRASRNNNGRTNS